MKTEILIGVKLIEGELSGGMLHFKFKVCPIDYATFELIEEEVLSKPSNIFHINGLKLFISGLTINHDGYEEYKSNATIEFTSLEHKEPINIPFPD